MRKILYIIIISILFLSPVERLDVAELEPVQTVAVSYENGVVLQTDTNNKGSGRTVDYALQDLENRTPGVIYLDTAQYLLVAQNAVDYVDELRKYLSPTVKVAMWDEEGSVESAARYLAVRKDLPKLKDWQPEEKS